MTLTTGARLGPYEVRGALGPERARAYRAVDTRVLRHVAIKILPSSLGADAERLARFEQEARAATALNHPNIGALHDIGSANGWLYVVTDLAAGSTLREKLNAAGPLRVRQALDIAIRVLSGLAAAHDRGIPHRDLTPDSVFITTDGEVKILDFGLALVTQPAEAAGEAAVCAAARTVPQLPLQATEYGAPEQTRGVQSDHRADIPAFGSLLYEMLTARRPSRDVPPADALAAVLTGDPPDPSALQPSLPAAIILIMRRCLEQDPADRFQSARDVGFAIEAVAAQMSNARPRTAPRGSRLAWLLAIVFLGSTVLFATLWTRGRIAAGSMPNLALSVTAPTGTTIGGTPALAPDGRTLAFVASDRLNTARIWLQSFDRIDVRALPGTEGANHPFWSPDSRSLGFFANGRLWTIDLGSDRHPTAVGDAADPHGGTWTRDGTIVYAAGSDGGLHRVSAAGGSSLPLTSPDRQRRELWHRWPRFLPDGRMILFLARVADAPQERHVITTVSVDGRDIKPLTDAESTGIYSSGRLLFLRGGQLFSQPLDLIELTLTGSPSLVTSTSRDGSAALLDAFDAVEGLLATRPRLGAAISHQETPVIDVRFNWRTREGR